MSLKNTQMILSMPLSTITPLVGAADLVVQDLPFELPKNSFSLCWHKRNNDKLSHKWFREQFKSAIQDIKY